VRSWRHAFTTGQRRAASRLSRLAGTPLVPVTGVPNAEHRRVSPWPGLGLAMNLPAWQSLHSKVLANRSSSLPEIRTR